MYGTPRSFIDDSLHAGFDVIMKPEVNGALAIKQHYPAAVLVFLAPDKFSNLRRRLEARSTETNLQIAARLEIAHTELTYVRHFDYLVINEQAQPDIAVDDLEAIVRAERLRIHRLPDTTFREMESN